MLLETLDCSMVAGIFGLEVCMLVGRFSLSILSMKVLSTCKYVWESLSSSLLVTCIVTGANDSMGILGANDPAGIYFSLRLASCSKVATCCFNH
jgi:hypothetical protein